MTSAGATVSALLAGLDDPARGWLVDAAAAVRADASTVVGSFAAAGRTARRALGPESDDPWVWQAADALRASLILALPPQAGPWLRELDRFGDTAERRGVLRALDLLDEHGLPPGGEGARLVRQALRANEPRLVAAALGRFGTRDLDDAELAQAVLKAVFLDLDVRRVPGVTERVTPALSSQLLDLALERVAAGRPLAAGVWELVARCPDGVRLEQLQAELGSSHEHRRRAARAALDDWDRASAALRSASPSPGGTAA